MTDYRPVEPHGAFSEVFPDVFMITGRFRFAPTLAITRNMFAIRQGGELVIVSTMRLSPSGEAELEKLGTVKHVVRIGGFHGADDRYYLDRYKPTFWAPAGLRDAAAKDRDLAPGSSPIEGSDVFLFENGSMPEAAMVLRREGGILLTADSFQNWTTFEGCSLVGKVMMRAMGFGPSVIGGPWAKQQGTGIRKDFDKLAEVDVAHVMPGHGTVLKGGAKAGIRAAMAHRFGE